KQEEATDSEETTSKAAQEEATDSEESTSEADQEDTTDSEESTSEADQEDTTDSEETTSEAGQEDTTDSELDSESDSDSDSESEAISLAKEKAQEKEKNEVKAKDISSKAEKAAPDPYHEVSKKYWGGILGLFGNHGFKNDISASKNSYIVGENIKASGEFKKAGLINADRVTYQWYMYNKGNRSEERRVGKE